MNVKTAEANVHPSSLLAKLEGLVDSHVSRDRDVRQFRDFYERRLERELTKSDSGERRDKLVNDLSPHVTSDVSAIEFTIAGPHVAEGVYRFQRGMPYRSLIEIDGDRVTAEPRRNRCGFTSAEVPEECLETCQVTGRRGLRELMARSDVSGGYAVPESMLTCSLTGRQMLQTEAETCAITGDVAARDALAKSELSGRYVMPNRTAVCEFTAARVADDELRQSCVSGKWFRRDEAVVFVDGTTAHASEATKCDCSGNVYRKADCVPSAYSGKDACEGTRRRVAGVGPRLRSQ